MQKEIERRDLFAAWPNMSERLIDRLVRCSSGELRLAGCWAS